MKSLLYLFLAVACLPIATLAQDTPKPETIWKEYLEQGPQSGELVGLMNDSTLEEPYKIWCAMELSQRDDLTNLELRDLMMEADEPYAGIAWTKLLSKARLVDFLLILRGDRIRDDRFLPIKYPEYYEKALQEISQRFSASEIAPLLGAINNEYGSNLAEIFLDKNPSEDEILEAYASAMPPLEGAFVVDGTFRALGSTHARDKLVEEIFAHRSYSNRLLVAIITDIELNSSDRKAIETKDRAVDLLLSNGPTYEMLKAVSGETPASDESGKRIEEALQISGRKRNALLSLMRKKDDAETASTNQGLN